MKDGGQTISEYVGVGFRGRKGQKKSIDSPSEEHEYPQPLVFHLVVGNMSEYQFLLIVESWRRRVLEPKIKLIKAV